MLFIISAMNKIVLNLQDDNCMWIMFWTIVVPLQKCHWISISWSLAQYMA